MWFIFLVAAVVLWFCARAAYKRERPILALCCWFAFAFLAIVASYN